MGRGIALVFLRAFAADPQVTFTLMDVNSSVFPGVEAYLRTICGNIPKVNPSATKSAM